MVKETGRTLIAQNKKARHDYAVEQQRCAPDRGLGTESRHRRQISPTADPQQRKGIAC